MKNLVKTFAVILGLNLATITSFAADIPNVDRRHDTNPWEVFKSVSQTFHIQNGTFQQMSSVQQEAFFAAAEKMKDKLSTFDSPVTAMKIKHITLAESIFKVVWDSKNPDISIDLNMPVPAPPKN